MSGDVETMKTYTEILPSQSTMQGEGVCKGSLKERPSLETQEDPKPLKMSTPPLCILSLPHHERIV